MVIEIDKNSGFCFGVVNAIKIAEQSLGINNELYSLGDIVHNGAEIQRLQNLGLKTISRKEYFCLKNCKVLIRAHGEPPETYEYATKNNITLIDATCPVVLKLQKRIKTSYLDGEKENGQIVILGKKGHAEVTGLRGQTSNNAIVVNTIEDLDQVDFERPITLYSQTTMPISEFVAFSEEIKKRAKNPASVTIKDTICRQVSNRVPRIKKFIKNHDLILFVSGKKSSNGKFLYSVCEKNHPHAKFISNKEDLKEKWFEGVVKIGICGGTSTPSWLMEEIAYTIKTKFDTHLPLNI